MTLNKSYSVYTVISIDVKKKLYHRPHGSPGDRTSFDIKNVFLVNICIDIWKKVVPFIEFYALITHNRLFFF